MITFSETEYKLNIKDIEEIEKFIDLKLPNEYKEHLLLNNGGRCEPNIFDFNEKGKITSSNIDWFLAIYNGEYDNLKDYLKIYKIDKKRLPTHIFPFALDAGGNLICISCGSNDFGSIYFWDHENEIDYHFSKNDDYSNLFFIAGTFKKFIEMLR